MDRWYAPYAWLGGPELTAEVTVEVEGGIISGITTGPAAADTTRLGGVLLPGFVTAHSHAFHRALRGRTQSGAGNFWTWRDHMYRVAHRLTPASYRRLAAEVFGEMLRAGYTTVGEFHYLHHRPGGSPYSPPHAMEMALVEAAAEAGIRLTLIDTCYLTGGIDRPLQPNQAPFSDRNAGAWARRVTELAAALEGRELVRLGVAAHSVRAVPPAALARVAEVGNDLDAPIHVHLSEQPAENQAALAHHGRSPTRLLAEAGMLGPTTTAVHATHLTPDDIALLAQTGTSVCLCPTTEADLGDGIGPAAELRAAGVSLSTGSDSNTVVDPFREATALEYHDRLRLHRRGVHPPQELAAMATVHGSSALGWGRHQPLAVGAPADWVVVDLDHPDPAGFDPGDGIGGLLFSASAHAVTEVMVGGRPVVQDGVNTAGQSPAGLGEAIREVIT